MYKKIICLCLLLSLLLPLASSAEENVSPITNLTRAVEGTGLAAHLSAKAYVGDLVKVVLGFLGVMFVILIIYGGYIWMMSQGDEKEVKKAQDIIKSAIIGVAIVLFSYIITDYILNNVSTAIGITPGA